MTWRAILIGILLIPPQAWWIATMEIVHTAYWPTTLALPMQALFILAVLVGGNKMLRRWLRNRALSQGELLTIYIMLAISGALAGWGQLQALIPSIVTPIGKATPENRWASTFVQYLPTWLAVQDLDSLRQFMVGNSTFLTAANLRAWAVPALSWGAFLIAIFVGMLSLNSLLRRRWIEEEKLSFPLVQLPLALVEPAGTFFRSRLLWLGFGIAALLSLLNGLHVLFPSIPGAEFNFEQLNAVLSTYPGFTSDFGGTIFNPYPWAVGVAFFMPLEVSFSYWFFFWFMKLQQVLTVIWGWDVAPGAPFPHSQSAGALVTIGVASVWLSRRYLLQVLRAAWLPQRYAGDTDEPLRYRHALALFVLSLGFVTVFTWHAGAPLWMGPAFFGLYIASTLALVRIRAELGPPADEIHSAGPQEILTQMFSPGSFPARALVMFTALGWTSRSYGCDSSPFQMEGFKMAERTRLRTRGLAGAMVVAAVVGIAVGYVALLQPIYRFGAESKLDYYALLASTGAFSQLQNWLTGMVPAGSFQEVALGGGVILTLVLYALRARFVNWPLLPVGYVIAPTWFAHHLWLSVFVAWTAKLLLMRYGGLKWYARALPFFAGLILGDCAMGSIWAIIGAIWPIPPLYVWGVA
ncbi:MAG: DUF6785 family protein [Armatimonadota bacterium]